MELKLPQKAIAWIVTAALALGMCPGLAYAGEAGAPEADLGLAASAQGAGMQAQDGATIESVRAAIQALSADPTSYTAADKEAVEALKADFDSLSAADQATLDAETSHTGTGQPLGRVLESALWAVWSYGEVDNSTTLADKTYNAASDPALSSEYSKGKSTSSRQKPWSVKDVTVKDGKATATITVESSSYSGIWMGGTTYPKTNASGNCEFANVPVDLNSTFYFAGISTSMPVPIAFSLTTQIEEPEPAPAEEPVALDITNNTGMFKAVSASYEPAADGSGTLVMALSGTGYHWLYKGTYAEALAANSAIASGMAADEGSDKLIRGYQNDAGQWEFRVPIAAGESYVACVAISDSYYTKYLNGQNVLERAYYPRQFEIDVDAATLVTGDYDETADFTLTSEVADFKAASPVAVRIVGGPNSNNYNMAPTFAMQDGTYDKVTYPTVVSGEVSTATADLDEGAFAISLLNAPNKEAFKDKEPVAMTFHVAADAPFEEAGTDVVRNVTFDQLARTITIAGEPLTPKTAELTAGTYEATSVKTDVTTDESGMIMVTKATVVINEEGKATAIVTMKGTGADRFYISDTAATHDALLEEAVAEEAKEIDGQESKLIGCYKKEGESAYTFWPIPITLGEPKVYAARSHSHFTKWDLPRKNYFYVHDFQIDAADLTRVSDSTQVMTPEIDAEVLVNQFYVNNGISSNHASVIKAKNTNVTVPYYDGDTKISSFNFKRPDASEYVSGWFIDDDGLSMVSSSNKKKVRYPGFTDAFKLTNAKRDAGGTFTATLKLYPVGTVYDQYDASGTYYYSDSEKTAPADPLAEQTFTIAVESKPQIDFNVGVTVADQKTGEAIANPTISIVDEADNTAVEPNEDGTYKLNALKKYTVSASAEGYLAQGGAEAATKTGFSPSKEGETVALKLLKTADASHTLTLNVADQFGEAVVNPAIRVWLYGTQNNVEPNADGTYTLWDSESYVCEVSAEGYETAKIYPRLTEDATEAITVNKYLSEHTVLYTIRDADTNEVLDGVTLVVTNNTAGGTIAQNEDGSFTVPADASITCVASKEGYLGDDFTHVPSGFDPVVQCSFSLKVNYETQLKQEIAKATEYAGSIEEAEEPGKWPAGTKAPLTAAIADAQAVLDNAESTETEFEAALTALKAAEKVAKDAQYACVANVTVRVNKTPGGAAELYKLAVSADASKTYKYAEPTTEGKQVTFLDVLVALHEEIYGEDFKAAPTTYFDSQNVGWYFIKTLFESGNYFKFAFNGESVSDNGYQKFIVSDGGVADVSLMVSTNDVFLSFGELEAETTAEADFTATLTKGVGNSSPAEGFTVTYADEAGNEVSGVTDAEGKVTVAFPAAGTYTVKSVANESVTQALIQPYQKVVVGPAKPSAGQYIIDGTCWNTKTNKAFTMVAVTYGGQAGKALLTIAEDGTASVTFDTDTRSTYNGVYLGTLSNQTTESNYAAGESNGKGGYLITVPVDLDNLTQDISIVPHKPAGSWYTTNPLVLRFGDTLTPLAVSEVEQLIGALPAAADVVATDKEAIEAARAAYDALSDKHQALVSNYDKLVAAEEAFANLPAMSDEVIATAAAIDALINSYPQVNEASAAAVAEARTAYDALDNVQKSYIPAETYDKLVRAEACVEFTDNADAQNSIMVDPCNPIDEGVLIGAVIRPMNNNTTTLWLYTTKGGFDKLKRLESTNPSNGGNVQSISGSSSLQRIYISMSSLPQGNEYRMSLLKGTQDTGMELSFKVPSVYGTMLEGTYDVLAQDPTTKALKFENATIVSDGTSMTAAFTVPSASYDKAFLGNAAAAAAAAEGFIAPNAGEGNAFTIPLQSMYQPIEISFHSAANDAWTTEVVEFVVDEQTAAAVDAIAKLNVKNYWEVVAGQREDVEAAAALYDALDDNQKALMANSNYYILKMTAPMFVVTDRVAAEIEALPGSDALTADDYAAVYQAKRDFDGMGNSEEVPNLQNSQLEKLIDQALRDKLNADLKVAAEGVAALIDALPAADAATEADQDAALAAKAALAALQDSNSNASWGTKLTNGMTAAEAAVVTQDKLDKLDAVLAVYPADYTAVDAAKAKVPEDLSIYTDKTAAAVTSALDAIVEGKMANEQGTVDAWAAALEKAVAALEKKPADYSAVEAAKAKVPDDLVLYTDETAAAVTAALEGIVEGKMIDEQAEVDAMAEALEAAVAALVSKADDAAAAEAAADVAKQAAEEAEAAAEATKAAAEADPGNAEKQAAAERADLDAEWAKVRAAAAAAKADQAKADAAMADAVVAQEKADADAAAAAEAQAKAESDQAKADADAAAAKAAQEKADADAAAAKAAQDKADADQAAADAAAAKAAADQAAADAAAAKAAADQAAADKAAADAKAAQDVADAAAAAAAEAQAKADADQAAADKAAADAKAAQDKADADAAAAAEAQAKADAESKAAADAEAVLAEAVKAACETAGIAYDEAKTPAENSAAASEALEGKIAAAEAAQKIAEEKAALAEIAQKAAEAAQAAAGTAQEAVEAAQATAEAAQKAAEEAQKAAEKAQATAGAATKAAEQKATKAEEAQKAAEQKAADAEKAQKAAETAKADADKKAAAAEKTAASSLKANTMTVKTKTVKAKSKKATKVKKSKAFTVKNAKGKVTFAKLSGNAKIAVSAKGKVTVKKGLKKGKTYKVKVLVVAKGGKVKGVKYAPAMKTVTLKVKVTK